MFKRISLQPAESEVMSRRWRSISFSWLPAWLSGWLACLTAVCLSHRLSVCLLAYLFTSLIASVSVWHIGVSIWFSHVELWKGSTVAGLAVNLRLSGNHRRACLAALTSYSLNTGIIVYLQLIVSLSHTCPVQLLVCPVWCLATILAGSHESQSDICWWEVEQLNQSRQGKPYPA